jgi:hypothetical protein
MIILPTYLVWENEEVFNIISTFHFPDAFLYRVCFFDAVVGLACLS